MDISINFLHIFQDLLLHRLDDDQLIVYPHDAPVPIPGPSQRRKTS